MGNSNLRAATPPCLPPFTSQDDLIHGPLLSPTGAMAAHAARVTSGLHTNAASLTVGNDKATSPESPSTETTISDDALLPAHVNGLHRWIRAADTTRPPLQHPDLTQEFHTFREEIRAELQAQAQRIEGFVANSKNDGVAMVAEGTLLSAQVSTLKAEGALYRSYLDSLRADFDSFVAKHSTLKSTFEHQVKHEADKLLDHCFTDGGLLRRMEQHICAQVQGTLDETLACGAASRHELDRRTMRTSEKSRGVWDASRDKQKPVTVDDEEDVVERATAEGAAQKLAVKRRPSVGFADASQLDSAAVLPFPSSASSPESASILGSPVPEGGEATAESGEVWLWELSGTEASIAASALEGSSG